MKRSLLCALLAIVAPSALRSQTPFSSDSASAYLRVLAGEIGPRPMGSPAERRAFDYALQKFNEFGLRSYLMEMKEAGSEESARFVNTRSGVAVGILKGATGRIIVIGGHIDSAAPEIPGANDDGSGSAVVIELARVLSKRQNQSTIVFCLFGGEEQGLRGSTFFAENFPEMDSVALMLQADMANGTGRLVPLIDIHDHSAPTWLVSAAYEEYRSLGEHGLSYPTSFLTLNSLPPSGGIGSDHMPFLKRGIPAIDFTSDLTDPIHTPQDNLELFQFSGLKRTGDLLYRLVDRFDAGVPEKKSDHYYLLDPFQVPIFIHNAAIDLFVALAVLAAIISIFVVRKRRTEVDRQQRPKVPALKLFVLMLIIQTCVWFSSNIVGLLKGLRYPWFSDIPGYAFLGLLAGLVGIRLALILSPALALSKDPYRWHLRAVVILVIVLVIFLLGGRAIAVAPAFALLLVSLAMLAHAPWMKFLLWLVSSVPMFWLAFSDGWLLFGPMSLQPATPMSSPQTAILHLVFIGFSSLWSFPFLLSFAAIHRDSDLALIPTVRRAAATVALVLLGIGWVVILMHRPTFTERWRQPIRISETVDLDSSKAQGWMSSAEVLTGTHLRVDHRDTLIADRSTEVRLFSRPWADTTWMAVEHSSLAGTGDSVVHALLTVTLRMPRRPYTLTVSYSGHDSIEIASPLAFTTPSRRRAVFSWYSFPDSVLTIPVSVTHSLRDTVIESIEATFVQPAVPVTAEKELSNVSIRTVVRRSIPLSFRRE